MAIKSPKHEVILSKENHWEQSDWCTKKFGKRWNVVDNRSGTWCCFWAGRESFGDYRWCFTNEQDMVLFLLRWQ